MELSWKQPSLEICLFQSSSRGLEPAGLEIYSYTANIAVYSKIVHEF